MEFYAVKQSSFLGASVHYVCQNINGPCPLLAICNVLILRRHLNIQPYIKNEQISSNNLIQAVKERLIATNQPGENTDELIRLTKEKIIQDVIQILPSLLVGLDVNMRFRSTTDFEYTVACAVFDMLDISLLHGWIVDDQDLNTTSVIDHKSYNELIEILANYRASLMIEHQTLEVNANESSEKTENLQEQCPDRNAVLQIELDTENVTQLMDDRIQPGINGFESSDLLPAHRHSFIRGSLSGSMDQADMVGVRKATALQEQGPVLEEFFDSSASQLTYFGLIKLHEDVRERQLCVFFRNNHFSTLFKYEGSLFLLVTDTGYLDEPTVVWEHLSKIDGDTEYYNAEFKPLNTTETRQQTIFNQQEQQPHIAKVAPKQQISQISRKEEADPDYLLAVKLQKEEEALANNELPTPNIRGSNAIESAHLGPQRAQIEDVAINSNNISSGAVQSSASDGQQDFICDSDGRVLLSKEEIEAQRQAETYFKEQKEKQDRTHGASYLGRITNTARRTSARRVDKQSDCSMM